MKRSVILSILCLLSINLFGREVHNINRNWKFFSNSEVTSDGADIVNLPHMWNSDALGGKRDYFRGIGNYLKSIDIPNDWRGKRIFIRCHGANSIANILVNGKHVGEHRGGFTSFAYDITKFVEFGKSNYIWIIVNNAPQLDVLPTAGDQNSYGGLFRDVELVVTNPTVVSLTELGSDGILVSQRVATPESAEGDASVFVNGLHDGGFTAELIFSNKENEVVFTQSAKGRLSGSQTSKVTIPYTIPNPVLWNGTINPYLYKVKVRILVNDVPSDSVTLTTGFRQYGLDSLGHFALNGQPYPIKGVVIHQDRAMVGTAITTYQTIEDLELIHEMGANAIRVANVQHNPEFYKLCDRIGFVIISDMPLIGGPYLTDKSFLNTFSYRNNCEQQVKELIYQQFNHPSVIMWSIFSEMSIRGDNPVNYIREVNTMVRNIDPSRMTVATSNEDGEINFITDLVIWNQHLGWREGYPQDIKIWLNQLETQWLNLKSGVSYCAGASIYHQDDSLYRPSYVGNWHPERWQTHFHEEYFKVLQNAQKLWGTFVGNMFDYGAVGRRWGEGNGINDCGLITFDRRYRKDAFYLYKANWNKDQPFVYIAERRWNVRKHQKQNIRIYSNCFEVELSVNGVSVGNQRGINGTFTWKDIMLNDGLNRIEAKSKTSTDATFIEIRNSNSKGALY